MHAFFMHIEEGIQENNGLICTKSYTIKKKRSRTRATDRFPVIIRWGNPICVYYMPSCDMIWEWNPICVLCSIMWFDIWMKSYTCIKVYYERCIRVNIDIDWCYGYGFDIWMLVLCKTLDRCNYMTYVKVL